MITISALGLFWLILGGFVAALSILLVINCLHICEYGIAMIGCFFLVISLLIVLHSLGIVQITA